MAAKKKGGCLASLLGFILVVAIIVLVLVNLTPNNLNLGDTVIPGIEKSCNQLGLGDTKIKAVIGAVLSLTKSSEDVRKDVVTNEIATDEQMTASNSAYGADTDYTNIFTAPLTLESQATLPDKEVGNMLNKASASVATEIGLPAGSVGVEQLNINVAEDGSASAEVTVSVELNEVLSTAGLSETDIQTLEESLGKLNISLTDEIFLSVDTALTTTNGVVSACQSEVLINGNAELTTIVSGILSGMGTEITIDSMASAASEQLVNALNNLGGDVSFTDGNVNVAP